MEIRNKKTGRFEKGHTLGFQKGVAQNLGKKLSEETKRKIGNSNSIALKGRTMSEEQKKSISEAHKRINTTNHFWKGGISLSPNYRAFIQKRRELRKKINGGTLLLVEWEEIKKEFNNTCVCCLKQEPEITLTIDHVTPISKGGLDTKENIQPLCMKCNNVKYMKIIDYRENYLVSVGKLK